MNQNGFTLIEIIAVIVVIGIVSAIAVPRYMQVQEEARISAAQGAIAEVKTQATHFYAIKLLRNGSPAPIASMVASVGAVPNVGNDFVVNFADSGAITVSQVRGVVLNPGIIGTWIYPGP